MRPKAKALGYLEAKTVGSEDEFEFGSDGWRI
jgi:hypothetical protein